MISEDEQGRVNGGGLRGSVQDTLDKELIDKHLRGLIEKFPKGQLWINKGGVLTSPTVAPLALLRNDTRLSAGWETMAQRTPAI